MELDQAIRERRSIRKFSDQAVSDREIGQLLEAARWAPSWKNGQVWEFIVVRDREVIEQITATYREGNSARQCSLAAPALIVACAKTGVSGTIDGVERTKFTSWFMFDLGLAVQNLCLKAHDLGLGTVVVGSLGHDRCRELLGLPEGYEVVVALPLGRPAAPGREGPARRPVAEFSHSDRFGTRFDPG
jgi:nitroreductase